MSNASINTLQINLALTKAATDQLQKSLGDFKSDILIQELTPMQKKFGNPKSWNIFSSKSKNAAITIVNRKLQPVIAESKQNLVAVKLQTGKQSTTFISAYNSPYANIEETLKEIQEMITSLKVEPIFIGTDFNGRHTLWGYRDNDARGENVLDFLLANDLYVINRPETPPTFQRHLQGLARFNHLAHKA
ncbi:hypothetical protein AVEN_137517-1 [Araneus ventricosus]|uniref:Endonuclease/exonuclease/phosphatase domain-containing protein n=1 Tax=Araneus ventricosus TaxID=182803 RepID=A0A4Y2QC92_ARAVE|nr:hypothetical protein AVEN_137517-1 [Araneus ventricosus]